MGGNNQLPQLHMPYFCRSQFNEQCNIYLISSCDIWKKTQMWLCAYEARRLSQIVWFWWCYRKWEIPNFCQLSEILSFFIIYPPMYVTLQSQILKHFIFLPITSFSTGIGTWISLPSLPHYFFCVCLEVLQWHFTMYREAGCILICFKDVTLMFSNKVSPIQVRPI